MRDIETILNDYGNGTFEVRLNLFLFHRELRREFSEIEKEESASINRNISGFSLFSKNKKRVNFPFGILKKRYQPAG